MTHSDYKFYVVIKPGRESFKNYLLLGAWRATPGMDKLLSQNTRRSTLCYCLTDEEAVVATGCKKSYATELCS